MISQAALQQLDIHTAKFGSLADKIDRIRVLYREK
jgi:hypothetical protein